MKIKSTSIKKGKPPIVIGVIDVPEYESIEEALKNLGEKHCLSLINRMLKREMTQDIRNDSKEKSTASRLKNMGISLEDVQKELLKMQSCDKEDFNENEDKDDNDTEE